MTHHIYLSHHIHDPSHLPEPPHPWAITSTMSHHISHKPSHLSQAITSPTSHHISHKQSHLSHLSWAITSTVNQHIHEPSHPRAIIFSMSLHISISHNIVRKSPHLRDHKYPKHLKEPSQDVLPSFYVQSTCTVHNTLNYPLIPRQTHFFQIRRITKLPLDVCTKNQRTNLGWLMDWWLMMMIDSWEEITDERSMQKRRERSSLLLGRQNWFRSLPRQLFFITMICPCAIHPFL